MGSYGSDDEALVGLARQLTDAYGEARTREDQDYACDAIAEYLSEYRRAAPSDALIALLDLPLTAETYPLVDEAQTTLSGRGPGVVEPLLAAALGEVYDPDGPAPERAAETLDAMDRGEVSLGLTEVLCGQGDDELKGAAVDALVALGGRAEPDLVATLDDPVGADWAQAALRQLRYIREHPGAADDESPVNEYELEDEGDDVPADDEEAADSAADDDEVVADDDGEIAGLAGGRESGPAAGGPSGPDQGIVDDSYDDFLRRFEQESGGDATTP